jgi:hypothetical protein
VGTAVRLKPSARIGEVIEEVLSGPALLGGTLSGIAVKEHVSGGWVKLASSKHIASRCTIFRGQQRNGTHVAGAQRGALARSSKELPDQRPETHVRNDGRGGQRRVL